MAKKNAKDGISMVQTAEGALTEVHDMLNRMVELATQAANGTYATEDRGYLDLEFQELIAEIDRIGSNSNFNGQQIFSANVMVTLQIGEKGTSIYQLSFSVGNLSSAADSLNLTGTGVSTFTLATQAISTVNAAIKTVNNMRATLGATQNRLEHTINNLGVMTENIQDAESTIRDTDIADEMMAYTKNNILIQS